MLNSSPLLPLCFGYSSYILPPPFSSVPSLVSHPSFSITAPPPSMYHYPPSAKLKEAMMAGAHTHITGGLPAFCLSAKQT